MLVAVACRTTVACDMATQLSHDVACVFRHARRAMVRRAVTREARPYMREINVELEERIIPHLVSN